MLIKIIKNTFIYFILIFGLLCLYFVDIEILLNPDKEADSQSKVNFIYQQF
jgi:hypothetical protein